MSAKYICKSIGFSFVLAYLVFGGLLILGMLISIQQDSFEIKELFYCAAFIGLALFFGSLGTLGYAYFQQPHGRHALSKH